LDPKNPREAEEEGLHQKDLQGGASDGPSEVDLVAEDAEEENGECEKHPEKIGGDHGADKVSLFLLKASSAFRAVGIHADPSPKDPTALAGRTKV
jgi:hypothetical protein